MRAYRGDTRVCVCVVKSGGDGVQKKSAATTELQSSTMTHRLLVFFFGFFSEDNLRCGECRYRLFPWNEHSFVATKARGSQ